MFNKGGSLLNVLIIILIVFIAFGFFSNPSEICQFTQQVSTETKENSYQICELINSNVTDVEKDIDTGSVRVSFENGSVYYDRLTMDRNKHVCIAKLEVNDDEYNEELVEGYLRLLLRNEVYDEIYQDYVDGKVDNTYEYANETVKFSIQDLPDNRKAISLESVGSR